MSGYIGIRLDFYAVQVEVRTVFEESYCNSEVLEDGVFSTASEGPDKDEEDSRGFFVRSMRGKDNNVSPSSAQSPLDQFPLLYAIFAQVRRTCRADASIP